MVNLMKKNQSVSKLISFGLLLLVASSSFASGGEGRERRGPPTEALEACESLSVDQSCSFTSRRGDEISGTCVVPKSDDSLLACKPEHGKKERGSRDDRGGSREER